MAELLLELMSEEIPARMQSRAADELRRLVTGTLSGCGLACGEAAAFATPRRLALAVTDVPLHSPGVSEERKGPRVGAPEAAVLGFLKAAGLASLSEARVVAGPRGDYYAARIEKPGRPAEEIIAEVIPEVCARFPWPKSMRWGTGTFRWIRPLTSVLCLFDGRLVPFGIAGLHTGSVTRGHRVHGGKPFAVTGFADYREKLRAKKVLICPAERAARIRDEAHRLAREARLGFVEDEALIAENAGLTEWPAVFMGAFDKGFLDIPAECLMAAMKAHQKCFALRHPRTGKLANRFLLVANLAPKDGGAAVVSGNEKVIRARLSDARFFWEQDLKRPLDEMAAALSGVTFHEKLGSEKERAERIAALAFEIAKSVDADPEAARRAAQLAKADLVSGMVGEFPELQGIMGRYYAAHAGTADAIARAIELHYKPKGPQDAVPRVEDGDAVAVAVALADKLDTLTGFWAIGEKPTGSGDPYQLRRAALGIIRIVLENDLRLPLRGAILASLAQYGPRLLPGARPDADREDPVSALVAEPLMGFFADRLKVYLREKGARHDLIDAVFALPGQDDLALIVKRVEALGRFLETPDGANLSAGVRRAASILAIEEKKDRTSYAGIPDGGLLVEPAEKALAATIAKVTFDVRSAIDVENFAGAMRALAGLRQPVDAFFDHVTVNADDPRLRRNRLALLSEIRAATFTVADFSRIAG